MAREREREGERGCLGRSDQRWGVEDQGWRRGGGPGQMHWAAGSLTPLLVPVVGPSDLQGDGGHDAYVLVSALVSNAFI